MRGLSLLGSLLYFLTGLIPQLAGQTPTSEANCRAVFELVEILDSNHVDPPLHNEQWATEVSSLLINGLDPRGLYLSLDDEAKIRSMEPYLIEDMNSENCEYLSRVSQLFWKRLIMIDSTLNILEHEPLSYPDSDQVKWYPEAPTHRYQNQEALNTHWKNNIKAQVLYTSFEQKGAMSRDSFLKSAFAFQLEQVQKVRCELWQITQHEAGYESYFIGKFMDAISASYDPHSGYYSLTEKELWDLALSTQSYSFGLEFERNRKGHIQISQLSPGGPAWKSQGLHKGDEILEIEYPRGKKLNIYCLSIPELAKELKSSRSNSIYLKIKKRNGEIHVLSLEKEILKQEENVISSFLLEGYQSNRKVGYIYLPAFYTESEEEVSGGCADDIARELLRLQAEGIEGLILDLRFNGGGSMKEAMNLAGIFIDRGPLAIYDEKGKKPTLLRDMNRGSLYEGPLVLMINGHSASASEILASALQDYERAVVVGSTSFGKSSGQIMLPVVGSGLGMAKVSIQRYYRITGSSYQLSGVEPDIILPNIDQVMGPKERDYLSPLTHSQTLKKTTFQKSSRIPYDILKAKSSTRVLNKAAFQEIVSLNQSLLQLKKQGLVFSLTPEKFEEGLNIQTQLFQAMQSILLDDSRFFHPQNNSFVESLLKLEPQKTELNLEQKNKIHKDIYVEEAYLILDDLIKQIGQ